MGMAAKRHKMEEVRINDSRFGAYPLAKKGHPRDLLFSGRAFFAAIHSDFQAEMVGAERFELSTSWSQTKRSTKLSYAPTTSSGMRRLGALSTGRKGFLSFLSISLCSS